MSKKKNVFDYISMGLRSKRTIEKNQEEKRHQEQMNAKNFNKAFSDKTYTVAKKVIDNVEKVAEYDFESFFSRVNDSIAPHRKQMDPKEREERSKDFEEKIKNHSSRFNIEDYVSGQKNYKNSIIEKTKKNIQKKKFEADVRNAEIISNSTMPNNKTEKKNTDMNNVVIDVSFDMEKKESQTPDIKVENADSNHDNITRMEHESINEIIDVIDSEETKESSLINLVVQDEDNTTEIENINNLSIETEISEENMYETEVDSNEKETIDYDDEIDSHSSDDIINDLENSLSEIEASMENLSITDEIVDKTVAEYSLEDHEIAKSEMPFMEEAIEDDKIESVVDENQIIEDEDITENVSTIKINPEDYTKESLNRNSKYYKQQRKEKFAKRMKVELDDNLIVQKQRTLRRLFKFSLSFKLSFVFILLMIFAVVSLSVAFYLGIDYVLELKDAGQLEDIQFFKDVLIILLIIFDFVAILLGISLGTKTSRDLVRPIDEMTLIVKQINAKEMDRRLNIKGMHDELKELAMTFNEMLDRIENSYETQNRFTSDASHELRTPIAVIQGYINMLDRWGKADGEILDESIEAIKSESHNMKRLTEKLLLLAKADKGILELEFKPFDLNELIKEISRETLMIDSNHTITNEINDVKTIIADRESLKQALRIFVDNSVKYTPTGGKIAINSYINKKKIYIEIKDNGIGISKEDMDNIFNRFYRVDKSRSKDSGGHGLGLSIAKWIVSQHKGEIEVKSELNKGTVITIILSPIEI